MYGAGYFDDQNCLPVTWFWHIVEAWDQEMRARLLQFVTGSSKVDCQLSIRAYPSGPVISIEASTVLHTVKSSQLLTPLITFSVMLLLSLQVPFPEGFMVSALGISDGLRRIFVCWDQLSNLSPHCPLGRVCEGVMAPEDSTLCECQMTPDSRRYT